MTNDDWQNAFFGNQIPWNEAIAPDAATVATIREAIADNKRKGAERNLRWINRCLAMLREGEGNA